MKIRMILKLYSEVLTLWHVSKLWSIQCITNRLKNNISQVYEIMYVFTNSRKASRTKL